MLPMELSIMMHFFQAAEMAKYPCWEISTVIFCVTDMDSGMDTGPSPDQFGEFYARADRRNIFLTQLGERLCYNRGKGHI